jgi:hypothetical protein
MPPRGPKTSWHDRLPYGLPRGFDYNLIRTANDAMKLIIALPNRDRGTAAKALYRRRKILGEKVAHSGLIEAWQHDHVEVTSAFGGRSEFVQALRTVSAPSERKRMVRAWRGVSDLDAAYGLSWTTDRDTACWFAMRHYERHQTPFVFFCNLGPDAIAAEYNGRNERELIVDPTSLFGCAMLDVCDGDTSIEACEMLDHHDVPASAIADWRLGFHRVEAAMKAEHANRLKALSKRAGR